MFPLAISKTSCKTGAQAYGGGGHFGAPLKVCKRGKDEGLGQSKDKDREGVPSLQCKLGEKEKGGEQLGQGSRASSVKGSSAGMVTVSIEELARLVAQLVPSPRTRRTNRRMG